MIRFNQRLLVIGLSPVVLAITSSYPVFADGNASPEVITDTRTDDGVTVIKLFAPKYRERLNNLKDQIDLGLNKGWLTPEQADHFRKEHERVSALEADVRSKGYQKADVANLEQQVTALNGELSTALTKGSTPEVPKDKTTNYSATPPKEEAKPSTEAGSSATPAAKSSETKPQTPAEAEKKPAEPAPK